jgi:hypothetical protein
LCLTSELNYPGINGIETSNPFWSMSGSLRYSTPTDDAFKVKENMSCDIEGRRPYTDAHCGIKDSTKSFQNILRIYRLTEM